VAAGTSFFPEFEHCDISESRRAMALRHRVNNAIEASLRFSRRLDRYYRDDFDHLFRGTLVAGAQFLINATRRKDELGIAEERQIEGEDELGHEITRRMCEFMLRHYAGGIAQRAGNTKTHGLLRAELEVLPELSSKLAKGIFQPGRTYKAWVRVAGPGPFAPPDLDDNGILSFSVKLMGVEGAKLLVDEQWTQDFTAISAPTFTTPDARENLKLQERIGDGTPALYFLNFRDSHLLDAIMQGLFARAHGNPLDLEYHSCVPYLLGEGQAMKFLFRPKTRQGTKIPKHPGPVYLREAMQATLAERAVEFDMLVQLQTHPRQMPIENAAVIWPEWLSPLQPVARLRIPAQGFDCSAQMAFDRHLSFNPWHALAEHRPMGNQNRVRRRIYLETSKFRQQMNHDARIEPTGNEEFGDL
jgi:hypothetical protein